MAKKDREKKTTTGAEAIRDRHLQIGWWSLLLFVSLGVTLEALHGFKTGFYLDVSNETRRLCWTLAHAHGALLSILNVVFALSLGATPNFEDGARTLASRCLIGALIALPLGFFLGGLFVSGGDPGIGIFLVPPGGLLLFIAVYLTARGTSTRLS